MNIKIKNRKLKSFRYQCPLLLRLLCLYQILIKQTILDKDLENL
nr:MAG TPA: hypothetical protein [Bacteriophage sp.]